MLYINNIALPEDQQSVIVNNVAAEKVYCNNELVWEYAPYPTCPGYTLYGDYFLSDTIFDYDPFDTNPYQYPEYYNKNVIVTLGNQTKSAIAKILSVEELTHLTPEQRKTYNGYYTRTRTNWELGSGSTTSNDYCVSEDGKLVVWNYTGYTDDDSYVAYGIRLGFLNPFMQTGEYYLYGDYYLKNVYGSDSYYSYEEAYNLTETVTISNGHQTKTVTAKVLSVEELETLTTEQRVSHPYYKSKYFKGLIY
jgi:hypothetical protein